MARSESSSSRPPARSLLLVVVWHVLVAGAILVAPSFLVFRAPFFSSLGLNTTLIGAAAFLYVVAAVAGNSRYFLAGSPRLLDVTAASATSVAILCTGLLVLSSEEYSRLVFLSCLGLMVGGLWLPALFMRSKLLTAALVVSVAAVGVVGVLKFKGREEAPPPPAVVERIMAPSQQMLEVKSFQRHMPPETDLRGSGGAITFDPSGRGYLLVTARGALFHVDWDERDQLKLTRLPLQVPINSDVFVSEIASDVDPTSFRVADIVARREGTSTRVWVSHHFWNADSDCFVTRLSTTAFETEAPGESPDANDGWTTVFESSPCLPIGFARGSSFAGEQIGGNLEFLDDGHLLMTVGDHQFDGWYHDVDYVQDPNADYGKTMLIDVESGAARIYTLGHRNPQGLVVDSRGRVWSTEHGPQGGDELNLLQDGGNYGYPYQCYGTEYGGVDWPLNREAPEGVTYIDPVFVWVPSIGISEVVSVSDPAFANWSDDLLVAALRDMSLWRVRIHDGRAIYAEPIEIGERVRDITFGSGEFVLWTDSHSIIRFRPAADQTSGAGLYTVHCGGCHDNITHRIGPALQGIFGKGIAAADGYEYSPALMQVEGRWTEPELDAFLADPGAFAPGNRMAVDVPDPEQRRQIIEFLRTWR